VTLNHSLVIISNVGQNEVSGYWFYKTTSRHVSFMLNHVFKYDSTFYLWKMLGCVVCLVCVFYRVNKGKYFIQDVWHCYRARPHYFIYLFGLIITRSMIAYVCLANMHCINRHLTCTHVESVAEDVVYELVVKPRS